MAAFLAPLPLTASPCQSTVLTSSSLRGLRLTHQIPSQSRAQVLPNMQLDVEDMHDEDIRDEPIDEEPIPEETKLFIGNLSWGTTESTLGEAFARYGTVIDARVVTDRFSGKSRGFGFIEYDAADSASEALEAMNGIDLDGRNIRVDRANKRQPRQRRQNNYY